MYQTSEDYQSKIYEPSTKHLLKIFINGNQIEPRDIKSCKPSQILFNNEFAFGSVTSQAIDLELNKRAVPETIERVYIESGIEGEIVPVGYFKVDTPGTVNNSIYKVKLIDDMVKFEFNYDGSSLVNEQGYAEIIQVLQDICNKAGVELRFYFLFKYA